MPLSGSRPETRTTGGTCRLPARACAAFSWLLLARRYWLRCGVSSSLDLLRRATDVTKTLTAFVPRTHPAPALSCVHTYPTNTSSSRWSLSPRTLYSARILAQYSCERKYIYTKPAFCRRILWVMRTYAAHSDKSPFADSTITAMRLSDEPGGRGHPPFQPSSPFAQTWQGATKGRFRIHARVASLSLGRHPGGEHRQGGTYAHRCTLSFHSETSTHVTMISTTHCRSAIHHNKTLVRDRVSPRRGDR